MSRESVIAAADAQDVPPLSQEQADLAAALITAAAVPAAA